MTRNNERLQEAFEKGLRKGLWKSQGECASVLNLKKSTFYDRLNGFSHGQPVVETTEAINQLLESTGIPAGPTSTGDSLDPVMKLLTLLARFLPHRSDEIPEGVIASPWFELILSGLIAFEDQKDDDIPFVLTTDSFRKLKGTITKKEIDDTVRLIRELRRRINAITQIMDLETRGNAADALSQEMDELYLAIELAKEVIPTGAAARMEALRQNFRQLRGT